MESMFCLRFGALILATCAITGFAQQHVPGEHDFIKIDVELIQLLNEQGLLADGTTCDTTGDCDPRLTVFLDVDAPLTAWPGGKSLKEYDQFFQVANVKSPIMNKNVSHNVCGGSVNKVNLRVHVVDDDIVSSAGVIEDFECTFRADYRDIAVSLSTAEWSPTQDCTPRLQGGKVKLQFRFRIYDIPQSECGIIQPDTRIRM